MANGNFSSIIQSIDFFLKRIIDLNKWWMVLMVYGFTTALYVWYKNANHYDY